MEVVRVGLF